MTKVKNGKGRLWRGLTSTSAVLLVFAVAGTQTAMTYTGTINSYLGTTTSKVVQPAGVSSDDTVYFTSEFGELNAENLQSLITATYEESVLEEQEGAVLLRNEDQTLPLASDSHVTLFGHAVVQPVYEPGGANSAAADTGTYVVDLHDALTEAGFSVNERDRKSTRLNSSH